MKSSPDLYYMTFEDYCRRAARFEQRGLQIWPDVVRYRSSDGKRAFLAGAQVQDRAGYIYDVPQRVLRFYASEAEARMVARLCALIALENGFRPKAP